MEFSINQDQKGAKMKVSKLAELKRTLGQILNESSNGDFPKEITFSRGIEFPKYKITVEEIEEDFFVDKKGTRWVKDKKDED